MDILEVSKHICICSLVHVPVWTHTTQNTPRVLFPVTPCTTCTVIADYLRFKMALLMWWEWTIEPHSIFESQFQRCWVSSVPSKISKSDDAPRTWQALVFFPFWFHLKLTRHFVLCFLTQPFIMFDRVKECFFSSPCILHNGEHNAFALKSLLLSCLQSLSSLLVSSLIKCVYMEQESCQGEPEIASSFYNSA